MQEEVSKKRARPDDEELMAAEPSYDPKPRLIDCKIFEPASCKPLKCKLKNEDLAKSLKLVVFDLHGTIFVSTKTLSSEMSLNDFKRNLKDKYKMTGDPRPIQYGLLLKRAADAEGLDLSKVIPKLNHLIYFTCVLKRLNPEIVFGIASMLELESFAYDLLKFAYERKGGVSPFHMDSIVGMKIRNIMAKEMKNNHDKIPHINKIAEDSDIHEVQPNEVMLIDNDGKNIGWITHNGYRGLKVDDYFKISDWNNYSK